MRALIHHPIQRTHRFVDIPAPAPEILIMTVWQGDDIKSHRSAGWPVRVDARKGEWHHDYYRLQPELRGDTYPEYEFVLSRRTVTSNGEPPHVQGLTAQPYCRPEEQRLRTNKKRREQNRAKRQQMRQV